MKTHGATTTQTRAMGAPSAPSNPGRSTEPAEPPVIFEWDPKKLREKLRTELTKGQAQFLLDGGIGPFAMQLRIRAINETGDAGAADDYQQIAVPVYREVAQQITSSSQGDDTSGGNGDQEQDSTGGAGESGSSNTGDTIVQTSSFGGSTTIALLLGGGALAAYYFASTQ